jgi:hypothetical protein
MVLPDTGQPFEATPNAEKHVLDADALRRRQLRSALLHGSRQTWRERQRIWPAAVGGAIAIVVIVAVVAIVGAFHRQQEIADRKLQEQQQQRAPAVTVSPASPSARRS